jgi:hypothetical protein
LQHSRRKASKDSPLNRAHVGVFEKRERLVMADLRLRDDAWPDTAIRPRGSGLPILTILSDERRRCCRRARLL